MNSSHNKFNKELTCTILILYAKALCSSERPPYHTLGAMVVLPTSLEGTVTQRLRDTLIQLQVGQPRLDSCLRTAQLSPACLLLVHRASTLSQDILRLPKWEGPWFCVGWLPSALGHLGQGDSALECFGVGTFSVGVVPPRF